MTGKFITFEGVEGCGKTTQVERLRIHLQEKGVPVEVTREPGGAVIAESIRRLVLDPANVHMDIRTELLLYEAARAQHVAERIRPALEAGLVVLCDRFADSTTAYQGGGRGMDMEFILRLHRFAAADVWPHMTVLIDLPVEEGLARRTRERQRDRIEREPLDFHQRVRDAYLRLARDDAKRFFVVDGLKSPDAIAVDVAAAVDTLLARR